MYDIHCLEIILLITLLIKSTAALTEIIHSHPVIVIFLSLSPVPCGDGGFFSD